MCCLWLTVWTQLIQFYIFWIDLIASDLASLPHITVYWAVYWTVWLAFNFILMPQITSEVTLNSTVFRSANFFSVSLSSKDLHEHVQGWFVLEGAVEPKSQCWNDCLRIREFTHKLDDPWARITPTLKYWSSFGKEIWLEEELVFSSFERDLIMEHPSTDVLEIWHRFCKKFPISFLLKTKQNKSTLLNTSKINS